MVEVSISFCWLLYSVGSDHSFDKCYESAAKGDNIMSILSITHHFRHIIDCS